MPFVKVNDQPGLRECIWVLLIVGAAGNFAEYDYLRTTGPFCPNALQLWYFRVPYAAGVARCGKGTIDGPELPARPTPPPVTSTTTRTVLTTIPGFQQEIPATCCTTLPPVSTAIPKYTTAPPYDYVWETTTLTTTETRSSSTTTSSTSATTISTTSYTSTSTQSMPWWWNMSYFSTTTITSVTSTSVTQTSSTSSTGTSTSRTTSTAPWPRTSTSTSSSSTSYSNTTLATTSTTSSSTSSSVTTMTFTTSTNTTSTATTTTTLSTTSSTKSSTTSFLPDPPVPCLPLCPRLTPTACRGELMSDEICETTLLDSPCFETSNLVFACPGTNRDPKRYQDLQTGHYGVKCWICSFDDSSLQDGMLPDVDLRTGYLLVDLKFGPNMLGNTLDENSIDGYAIFMTDLAGDRISESPVSTVAKLYGSSLAKGGCCEAAAYSARVTVKLPPGVAEVRFEVAPILTGLGPLAVGRISAPVADASPFNQATTSAARNAHHEVVGVGALLFVSLMRI
ncbi:unnamed protein product [Effrenium voratum]|nr:unnamed protein product [Effrenium voratum]